MRYLRGIWLLTRCIAAAMTTAATAAFPNSALACRVFVSPSFHDIRFADVVVIGRIENYRIIRDEAFRGQMLAAPGLTSEMRKIYADPKHGLLSDYARFDVRVDEVLVGQTSRKLTATWDNSTYGEPEEMAPGRYLVALRRPRSKGPPLRGPSATILPSPDPDVLTVLQAPCSSAFIYRPDSDEAHTIRRLIDLGSPDALGDLLRNMVPGIPLGD